MDQVDIELTKTRYNVAALLGWIALVLGLVGAVLQYFHVTQFGYFALAVGLIGGGIGVTFSGPLRTVTKHKARGFRPDSLE